jgi:outer membrane protein assembly factor BamB
MLWKGLGRLPARRATLGLWTLLAVAMQARADDWPQWLGPLRDGVWRETGIVEKFSDGGPPVRWRSPVASGYAGPAVASGRVFVTDRVLAQGAENHKEPFPIRPAKGIPGSERVLCLNNADRKLLWKHEYDCPYTCSYPLGPRTTPVVDDGKVYTLGTEGNLLCFDAATGKALWSCEFKKDFGAKTPYWGFAAHPLIDGKKLICIVGGKESVAVAFDKGTGQVLWKSLTAPQQGYCPPMIYEVAGKRQLIIWHAQAVNGLDPETGKVYWSHPLATYQGMSIATPRLAGDGLYLTAYPNVSVMLRLSANPSPPNMSWQQTHPKRSIYSVFSSPQLQDGYIYGVSSGGYIRCLDAATGVQLWSSLEAHGPRPSASAECFLIKNGDRYFVVNEHGDLIIARLTPKGYEEGSRAHLLNPTSAGASGGFNRDVLWSHPAFANKCIYMRNDKEIICASLEAR